MTPRLPHTAIVQDISQKLLVETKDTTNENLFYNNTAVEEMILPLLALGIICGSPFCLKA